MDAQAQFLEAIQAAGQLPPLDVVADGRLHRYPTSPNRRGGCDSGWYVLHLDGVPAGVFGDWRSGTAYKWCAKDQQAMTGAEQAAHRARLAAFARQRDKDVANRHLEASATAAQRFANAHPAPPGHPYLVKKGVKAHGLRACGEGSASTLLAPMYDEAGKLWSVQAIFSGGTKRFHPGARVRGCFYLFGGDPATVGKLCILEGFASAASVHEATGCPVAVGFSAGNLEPVAVALRRTYPEAVLTICADDDYRTPGNPGLTKATEAARLVGARLALPMFGPDRPEGATDFNDFAAHLGLGAVRKGIEP